MLKNRVFFFGDYQGLRRNGELRVHHVPTALAKSSCTSAETATSATTWQLEARLLNPTARRTPPIAGHPVSRQLLPVADFSAPAVNFFKLLPAPNAGAPGQTFNNYATSGSGIFTPTSSMFAETPSWEKNCTSWAAIPISGPTCRALLTSAPPVEVVTAQEVSPARLRDSTRASRRAETISFRLAG